MPIRIVARDPHENRRRHTVKQKREMTKLAFQTERIRELTTRDLPAVVGAGNTAPKPSNLANDTGAGGSGVSH